jgi:hypothetical protein
MVQVIYKKEENSLDYYSHRKLNFGERVVIEQYLLNNIATKTEYYKKTPAILNYVGINSQLVRELNQFHLKNTINLLKEKEKEVERSVKTLIDKSMQNYYFEQIGNTIIEMKKALRSSGSRDGIDDFSERLRNLVDAYNNYTESKVALRDVLPDELWQLHYLPEK